MSTVVMAACWPLQMPPTPKAVLIALADNATDHGACWPSIATISARTCFGKTAVIEAIQWLEAHGFLTADRSNGRHTRYQIIPTLDLFDPKPVRKANRSAKRTSPGDVPVRLAEKPVREADTNRKKSLKAKSNNTGTRGTRLPDEWEPGEELKAWAKADHPNVDVAAAFKEFRDYWCALPGSRALKLDWDATFRNRVRDLESRRPLRAEYGPRRPEPASFEHVTPRRRTARAGPPGAAESKAIADLVKNLGLTPPP
jgi:hypothetical protein